MPWVRNPHAGGVKIPETVRKLTRERILNHAEKEYAGRYTRLDIRFRGQFCYIDAFQEPCVPPGRQPKCFNETRQERIDRMRKTPIHLCRLRYFRDEESWSLAYFSYSSEKYEPCVFDSGDFHGTPEEGFDVGAVHLGD